MNAVRITILVDNVSPPSNCLAEHGLSLWIEADSTCILFDTGQGPALQQNAARLGIGVNRAQAIVLSHGHYDHSGGLKFAMEQNPQAVVYAHPDVVRVRFSRHSDRTWHAISMPAESKDALETAHHFVRMETPTQIADGIWTTGSIPRKKTVEDTGGDFFLDDQGEIRDEIPDDQALWLETNQGLVVILGCTHSGVINTLTYIACLTGARAFHTVIGGLHLGRASAERLSATVTALNHYHVGTLIPLHCTGTDAIVYLQNHFNGRVVSAGVGSIVSI